MDFELDEEQAMLRESVGRLLAKEYTFEARRRILATPFGFGAQAWGELAGQGVLSVGLPPDHGGSGGAVETMVVMEEFGRALVLEPFLSTVVLGGTLISELGTPQQQQDLFPRIAAGNCRMALAHHETGARYVLDQVDCVARPEGTGSLLSGTKTVVLDGAVADVLIVSAREAQGDGISLFLVEPRAAGVHCVRYRTQDGRNAADVRLDGVSIDAGHRLGAPGAAFPALERAIDRAIAALCAEAVGVMEALNHATLEYLKARRQFGQPIGRFQVLQHRMADMFIQATQARSMSLLATGRCGERDAHRRRKALSAAKAFVGDAARFIGQQAVQLHGGMGMSDELAVSHYFKRLTMINATFGDVDHHLAAVSDTILAEAEPGHRPEAGEE